MYLRSMDIIQNYKISDLFFVLSQMILTDVITVLFIKFENLILSLRMIAQN